MNKKMKIVMKYLIVILLCLFIGGYSYSKVYNSYLLQRSKAFYSQGLEQVNEKNYLSAILNFGLSLGSKDNYESYLKLGEVYSSKGKYKDSILLFKKGLLLLEEKEYLVDIEGNSMKITIDKINDEIKKNKNKLAR